MSSDSWRSESRCWLTADVHLSEQNKERVTLTYGFTFHSAAIFQTPVPLIVFPQQQKELLARRAPEGCNPSLRKKRGAGLFKRTCSLVFITSTFVFFFSPSVTRQSLKMVLTRPAEPKSKKSVAPRKGETCAPSWPRFQLSERT